MKFDRKYLPFVACCCKVTGHFNYQIMGSQLYVSQKLEFTLINLIKNCPRLLELIEESLFQVLQFVFLNYRTLTLTISHIQCTYQSMVRLIYRYSKQFLELIYRNQFEIANFWLLCHVSIALECGICIYLTLQVMFLLFQHYKISF